jgi:hypothetical protein
MVNRRLALGLVLFSLVSVPWAWGEPSQKVVREVAKLDSLAGPLVHGWVSDPLGEPLVGVLVSVFGANIKGGGLAAFTDEQGRFRLPVLPPGLYVLHAYLSGFLPSRSAQIEVSENGMAPSPISMSLSPLETPADREAEKEPGPRADLESRVAELKWLLRHGKRNILREQEARVPVEPSSNTQPSLATGIDITGEVGVLASDFGLAGVPGAEGGLDGQLAYARLDIPSGPHQRWLVSAQLMESTLSSWAAQAEWVSEKGPGEELRAGVAYGTHLYGDVEAFRPPEAGLRYRPEGDRTTEWFGSAFGRHRLQLGGVELESSLSYHHYSYLEQANYIAPRVALEWSPLPESGTILRGSVGYRVQPPGVEDLDLLARMVTADVAGLPRAARRGLAAERSLRYQLQLAQRLRDVGELEVRVFHEETDDQLLKAYVRGLDGPRTRSGWYEVRNVGDFSSDGVGLSFSRRFGWVAGSVGYTFGRYRGVATELGFSEQVSEQEIHDLTTTVETAIDRTRTRLYAVYKLSHFPSLEAHRRALGTRFNVEVNQGLPLPGGVEWEVLLAVRNLFYHDQESTSLLDESLVVDSPRRVLGGLALRF